METVKDILKIICAQILAKNTFFTNGFYDTFLHEEKGLLLSNQENQYLNITDVNGNYFYIGYKPKATVTLGVQMNNTGRTFNYNYDCFIVAFTEDMDDLILLNAVINSIGGTLQKINWVSTNVPFILNEELKPLRQDIINHTLSKMEGRQSVKISFTQIVQFQTQSCPINPADCGCGENEVYIPGADPCCVKPGGTIGQVYTKLSDDYNDASWQTPSGGGGGGGGVSTVITSVSSNYTAPATADTNYIIFVTAAANITLPTAVGNKNRYSIKKLTTGSVNVLFTGGQNADGSTTVSIVRQYEALEFISHGTNYGIF